MGVSQSGPWVGTRSHEMRAAEAHGALCPASDAMSAQTRLQRQYHCRSVISDRTETTAQRRMAPKRLLAADLGIARDKITSSRLFRQSLLSCPKMAQNVAIRW